MSGVSVVTPESSGQRRVTRAGAVLLAWAALFVLAGWLGRVTITDERDVALFWPAAGIAVLWLAQCRSRASLAVNAVAMSVTAYLVNAGTGAPSEVALLLAVVNPFQSLMFLAAVAYLLRLESTGLPIVERMFRRGPHALRSLGVLVVAATSAGLASAILGIGTLMATQGTAFDATTFAVWVCRQASGMIVVGGAGLILLAAWRSTDGWRDVWDRSIDLYDERIDPRLPEGVLLLAVTLAMFGFVFQSPYGVSLAFLLLSTTFWAGLRFPPAVTALHSLTAATLSSWFTVRGAGPFAGLPSVEDSALVSQLFGVMVMVLGLLLAYSRQTLRDMAASVARAERATAARVTQLTTMVDTINDGILVISESGEVLLSNPAGERFLTEEGSGGSPSLIALDAVRTLDGNAVEPEELTYRVALETGQTVRNERRVRLPGQSRDLVVRVTATPFVTDEAEGAAVIVFQDITADLAHREALANFAGVVAHDLLNPISVIDGWAESLAGEFREASAVDTAVGLPMVERIAGSATRMRELVSALLDYSTARDRDLDHERVALADITREIIAERATPGRRSLGPPQFEIGDLPDVYGDLVLVRQLMDNLIGNAVKYVAPGTMPRITIEGLLGSDGMVEVAVSDNGIGVPPEHREQIFDDFHRLHRDGYQGTGLGLAICARTVARHGGRIWVEDNPDGQGACFRFTLPGLPDARMPQQPRGRRVPREPARGLAG